MIGAGNVAWHFSHALKSTGYKPIGVYSYTIAHAIHLATDLFCEAFNELNAIPPNAGIYIIAVKDDAIAQIVATLGKLIPSALFAHTAGSVSIDVFKNSGITRYGVVYPLQTLSEKRAIDFKAVPLFIEGSNADTERTLYKLASSISNVQPQFTTSANRKKLHLAAVFASNFANHCFTCAKELTDNAGIDFKELLPLIDETCAKIHVLTPIEAQTGPAVRYDTKVMESQEALLSGNMRRIYEVMSQSIHKAQQNYDKLRFNKDKSTGV